MRALTGAHVVLLDQLFGVLAGLVKADEAVVLELLFLKALQNHVLLQRKVQNQAVLVPVFGNMAHARLAVLADGGMGDVVAFQRDLAVRGLFQPGEGINQIGLAVAVDARRCTRSRRHGQ